MNNGKRFGTLLAWCENRGAGRLACPHLVAAKTRGVAHPRVACSSGPWPGHDHFCAGEGPGAPFS
jgi:hypothetical protein